MKVEILDQKTTSDGLKMTAHVRIPEDEKRKLVGRALAALVQQQGGDPAKVKDHKKFCEEKLGGTAPVESLVGTFIAQAAAPAVINQNNLEIMFDPTTRPEQVKGLFGEGPAELPIELVIKPVYGLTSYDPVEVEVPKQEVTDDMLDQQIEAIVNQFARTQDADGPVAAGDVCDMDIVTTQDGRELPALTGANQMISLEKGRMPDSFVLKVIGMRAGEEREFDFTATDPNMPMDQGPVDTFHAKVKLNQRKKLIPPELTDEFVKKHFGDRAQTVEQMRTELRKDMQAELDKQTQQQRESAVDAELAKRIGGHIPDELYERAREMMLGNMQAQLAQQGLTVQQWMQQQGMSEQQFGMMIMMDAMTSMRQGFALDALYRHIDEPVTDADMEAALHEMAPGNEEEARRNFDANDAWFVVREMAERMKAHNYAVAHATFIDD